MIIFITDDRNLSVKYTRTGQFQNKIKNWNNLDIRYHDKLNRLLIIDTFFEHTKCHNFINKDASIYYKCVTKTDVNFDY